MSKLEISSSAEESAPEGLHDFLQKSLPAEHQREALQLRRLSGDAGFRSYYRLNVEPSRLAVFAPPATEDSRQFCRVAGWMIEQGIRAPNVLAVDFEQGFMLIEDFGDQLLQGVLDNHSVSGFYGEALTMLLHMQSCTPSDIFPAYSADMLHQELDLFQQWFVDELLGLRLNEAELGICREANACLVARAVAQPQVVVHRDFHSRNILVSDDGSLATIDFQDAVLGPLTYDLVSLLKDCYVAWPEEHVERWALSYGAMARDAGLLGDVSEKAFLMDFHWMGMQRHLKVLGIFSRLYLRDGKTRYLADLPRVMAYTRSVARCYPQFTAFSELLEQKIIPHFELVFSKISDEIKRS